MARDFGMPFLILSMLMVFGFGAGGEARGDSLTPLYSFCINFQAPNCIDGKAPASRLLQVGNDFYGTTASGGLAKFQTSPMGRSAYGTLHKISTDGTFKLVYTFCAQSYCADGAMPANYLTLGPRSEIYGVARGGGKLNSGTIFKLSALDKLKTIYHFCAEANCTDGFQPVSVIFGKSGTLFGTAAAGGSHGGGTAFTIDGSGAFHVLYSFCAKASCADGLTPNALILGKDGNFYGTTAAGGKNQAGTVFRMTAAGVITTLYSLCSQPKCPDGEQPTPTLALGTDGNLYGTTQRGGANGDGAIFKITPAGVWETLYSFCKDTYCYDGNSPMDGLVAAKDGGFYGAASSGGRFYNGVVFHVTAAGDYGVIYNFCAVHGCFDGAGPFAAPTIGTDGYLYGMTSAGGDIFNFGAIYRLKP
jgi:uncharacterized repeat protein (TIGR03803 family)